MVHLNFYRTTIIMYLFVAMIALPILASCSTDDIELPPQIEKPPPSVMPDNENNNTPVNNKLKLTIGTESFSITLANNSTAEAFKAMLPITLDMSDLNGNEKFYNLSTNLPTAAYRYGTIQRGDLMLFGSNCLVLFYEPFSSSYSYTHIGGVDDSSKLAASLGSGNANVKFEITKN